MILYVVLILQSGHWEDSLGCFRRAIGCILQRWGWTIQGSDCHIWC